MSLRPLLPAVLCAACVLGLSALDRAGVGQDDPPATADFQPTTEGAREGIDVYPRRLPPGMGVLRLSGEQKERVYAVQAKYHGQIETLRDQIAALEAEQEKAVFGVLTPAQRDFLKAWEAMKAAEAAREAAEAEAAKKASAEGAE